MQGPRLAGVFGQHQRGTGLALNTKGQSWWTLPFNELGDSLKSSFKLKANPFSNPRTADEWEPYLLEKRRAAAEFQKILDHRGWNPLSQLYPLAHLGLARAAALAGDTAKSRKAYQDFFAIWKDADLDLPILIEAKKEYDRLK